MSTDVYSGEPRRAGRSTLSPWSLRGRVRTALPALALCLGLNLSWMSAAQAASEQEDAAEFDAASDTLVQVARWVLDSRDNRGLPFAVIDKATAQVFVFGPDGELRGFAPVLIGLAHGDDSVPGIGDRELAKITPEERTTPAGRFLASYGPAAGGKTVLWVDYATAVSLHEVVTSDPKEQRIKRLTSPTPDDNRITYGCINVSKDFYKDVVRPTFRGTDGVFYILPETRTLAEVLPAFKAPKERDRARKEKRDKERGRDLAAR